MIKHIVCWKLKEEDKPQHARKVKQLLESLQNDMEFIRKIEVGINSEGTPADNWDVVLYSEFDTLEELNRYQVHPKHKEAGVFIKSVVVKRVCVDYHC
ncbi:MAG: Dabb family protein [Chitinophagales bacterium]